jgi:hypothetical protein
MEKEYIVTVNNFDDLESFYDDMETPGGTDYIPDREVECLLRRDISRNTHYLLNDEEAQKLQNDSRIIAVELPPEERGIEATPFWTQTANFKKELFDVVGGNQFWTNADKNWGLYRVINGSEPINWGRSGSSSISSPQTNSVSTTIKTTSSGKNVDVVIVDEHINPDHPEFAVNENGTGGSRVKQIDWFVDYSSYVGITATTGYSYIHSGSHGTHVAGTVAGNTQGWARDANIYNIDFNYPTSPDGGTSWSILLFDYIRAFHKNKPINPETGRRNPTITNNSWGYTYSANIAITGFSSVTYRQNTVTLTNVPNSSKRTILEASGVPVPNVNFVSRVPARVAAVDADIQDAINDGIIVVAAAGNGYFEHSYSGHIDYNNHFIASGFTYYYAQGGTPAAAANVVSVGAINSLTQDVKVNFSDWGPRVDVWAPGDAIISSVYDANGGIDLQGVSRFVLQDPRNSSYYITVSSGTSMASPQVTGVLACLLEQQPDMSQAEVVSYIKTGNGAKSSQVRKQEPNSDWVSAGSRRPSQSPYDTLGSDDNNRFLYYWPKRPHTGHLTPSSNHKARPTTGHIFPRIRGKR